MVHNQKTKAQLIEELESWYACVVELERIVAEQKAVEQGLFESEERFRKIFDHSNDGIFLIAPAQVEHSRNGVEDSPPESSKDQIGIQSNRNGAEGSRNPSRSLPLSPSLRSRAGFAKGSRAGFDEILDANAKACQMLGYSREELLSLPISAIHPNEMSQLRAFAGSVLEQGQGWTDELTCRTKSGTFLPVEISASVLNVGNVAGKACILALVRDISKRVQAAEALARLASFPEQNPNPVIETDLTGHVTYCNPAARERFADLYAMGHDHPILGGVKPIIMVCQSGEQNAVTREIHLGDAIYEQKICCVPQSDLIRIFIYDLTERKRAEALELENAYLREEMQVELAFGEIVGQSQGLRQVLQQIELVAPTDASVLISGESGTGKELVARAIHACSQRSAKTMVKVNCGAIPRELFESEFFGHVKGAFTGALKDRRGRFELADGGTLFLDEVSEIPLELQSKLLRVLQEGQFERVGDEKTRQVNVRIIAATNRDLKQLVAAGRFREDLFYRLSVFPITVPPLRERREDIPTLATHFVEIVCTRLNRPKARLTPDQMKQLQRYDWPGNVRELQNVLERAVIVSRGDTLQLDLALPSSCRKTALPETVPKEVTINLNGELASDSGFVPDVELKRREQDNIVAALEHANWKVSGPGGAAEVLGIKPTTLISRMKKMGIQKPP